MAKYSINLLQADLLPARALWTLNRVVTLWIVALVVMLGLIFIAQLQVNNLEVEFEAINSQNISQTSQLKKSSRHSITDKVKYN